MASEDLYISGQWQTGYGKPLKSYNPATNDVVWEGSNASESDVTRAINAARAAWPQWDTLPLEKRIEYIQKLGKEIEKSEEALITAISCETGKPLWDCKGEVAAMKGKIEISINAYRDRCEKKINGQVTTKHRSHGTVAVLGPFNFPGHLPNGHIVPALIAGNTLIFKPSELTPLVGKLLTECIARTDIPPGVFNMVQGGKEIGKAISKHEELNGLFFTGSYGTGKALMEEGIDHPGKILALELGGNNPLIFDEAADLKAAAYITIQSAYLSSGQRCSCARRLIVAKSKLGDQFIDTLAQMISTIRLGSPTEIPEPFMGPVINIDSAVKILSKQASLLSRGAKSIVMLLQPDENKSFLTPGLIDVTNVDNREDEEVFGPLLQVIRTQNFHDSLIEANKTAYGLSAGILTDKKENWETFYRAIRAGIINWNAPITGASSAAPFGGVGKSGNFRPSAYYAADYCSYPVASMETEKLTLPQNLITGVRVD